ncbi:hypothetical protein [Nostoc sp. 'Peltigera malacea cyanobiont' DB3992]|nr:hypothetical protein [Nostoc sp. 'Peltigera malacea cyanobiont' DB3992]
MIELPKEFIGNGSTIAVGGEVRGDRLWFVGAIALLSLLPTCFLILFF